MEPIFLTLEDVLELHEDQLRRYGGKAGIISRESLDSAVAQPAATFGGANLHSDIYQMAAAYLYHIVQNHPFEDGNKRTGTAAALVFLDLNGIEVDFTTDELVEFTLAVAQGRLDREAAAQVLQRHAST